MATMQRSGSASASAVTGQSWEVGSVTLPRCLGGNGEQVPLRAHILLGAVPAMACVSTALQGGTFAGVFFTFVATGPLLFGTVLVHEMGHLIQATRRGAHPVEILLWPLGGLAISSNASDDPRDRIAISASGPATHAPMAAFWLLVGSVSISLFFESLAMYALWLNVSLCAFNLLVPCFPLDCSQILVSAMILRGKGARETATIITAVSVPLVALLACYGAWTFVTAGTGVLTVFVALWLGKQTFDLHSAAKEDRLGDHPLFRNPPRRSDDGPTFSPMNECTCGLGPCVALAVLSACVPCS